MAAPTFAVIDGHAMIFRGYYALPPLHTDEGQLVNAVFGFTTILLNILQKLKPTYLAVTFDMKGPTFRHESYENYKATRKETPDDLLSQIPLIRSVVEAFQIPIFERQGFEADDLIASLATHLTAEHPELEFLIVSGDMDLTQLINERVKLLSPLTGFNEIRTYDIQEVFEKYGVYPHQMVDYKALVGDVSDNIIGVPGIGKKTAATLLTDYENLDGIYAHLDSIKGALHEKLKTGRDSGYQSQQLVQLIHDVPIEFDLQACATHQVDAPRVQGLFEALNFKRLLTKFNDLDNGWKKEEQPALF
ncbi:MAG: DNA polymerase I [uncultured bacterium]|nr:MAG: DNA polymerase I [uncultured bacterium]